MMTDKPRYLIVLVQTDGAVVVDDFPSSDLLHCQTRAKELNRRYQAEYDTYRVAELRYVDEES